MRWDEDRATDALASFSHREDKDRSFSGFLKRAVHELHHKVFGYLLDILRPRPHTGSVTLMSLHLERSFCSLYLHLEMV